ncbi:MAG: hypothetical protein HUU15_02625 [Candidatus Brocadiae bacterium]|nr:hypothetical protein [Candidatus Brocadiia bacterium]
MKILAAGVLVLLTVGCDSMPLIGGDSLKDDLVIESDPSLLPQTQGKDHVLKVTVRDRDGVLQQDARVLVGMGTGGTMVKLTDSQGEVSFTDVELKKVTTIKVEKTDRTRNAGT